jgi:hypothetical protein
MMSRPSLGAADHSVEALLSAESTLSPGLGTRRGREGGGGGGKQKVNTAYHQES